MALKEQEPFIKAALRQGIRKWPKLLELALQHHHISRAIQKLEEHVQAGRLERKDAVDAAGGLYQVLIDEARKRDPGIPIKVFKYSGNKRTLQGILGYDPFPPEFGVDLEHPEGNKIIRVRSALGANKVEIIPKKEE